MAALMLQEQSWIVARKTIWSTKLKLLSSGPLLKNISDFHLEQYCYSYLYIRFPWGAFNNPMPYTFQPQSLEVQLRLSIIQSSSGDPMRSQDEDSLL